jgi:hypothetical protein
VWVSLYGRVVWVGGSLWGSTGVPFSWYPFTALGLSFGMGLCVFFFSVSVSVCGGLSRFCVGVCSAVCAGRVAF